MSETVIIALISLLGTLGGTFGGILATRRQAVRRKNKGRKSQD